MAEDSKVTFIGLGKSLAEAQNSEPDPDVIGLLTTLLDDAKSGKIKSVAMAGVSNLGEFLNATAGQGDFCKLLGAIEIMKYRLQSKNIHIC